MKTHSRIVLFSVLLFSPFILAIEFTNIWTEVERITDPCQPFICIQKAIVRGDITQKEIALIFSGDSFADGGKHIRSVLKKHEIESSFFFTGHFYRNPAFEDLIHGLIEDNHYLGAHSNRHLLYNDWENRDSLLVSYSEFTDDLLLNYKEMEKFGIQKRDAHYYLPPYEWYNETIANWTDSLGFQLINMTHGTLSHADYITPEMANYRSSDEIYESILEFESSQSIGLNGFILLIHIGTDPDRTDKFYLRLNSLLTELRSKGYQFKRIDELLSR